MISTIIIFLLVLGLLVFVHELGHFTIARRNGIKADEFGFGFPPRLIGAVWNDEKKRYHIFFGNKEVTSPHTVYSLNWIPLGGFVKIKGEDGGGKTSDSFAVQSPWVRIKVLSAGVTMNFLLAWALITIVLTVGFPQSVDPNAPVTGVRDIQISQVLPGTPAESMGLRFGDRVLSIDGIAIKSLSQMQQYILEHKGQAMAVRVERGDTQITLRGTPRVEYPQKEGSLGIGLNETEMVHYPWHEAIYRGAEQTARVTRDMAVGIATLFGGLISGSYTGFSDVSGPVGIAKMTGQVSDLGLVYLLYFAAILSINLGIVNILPIPALDGGRILFIVIEMIKGSPVSQKTEGIFHQIGMALLLLLMVVVTVHDIAKLHFWG